MTGRLLVVALVAAVLVSGCSAPVPNPDDVRSAGPVTSTPADPSATATESDRAGGGATPTAAADGATRTATAVDDRTNPWGEDPIVVAVESEGDPVADLLPVVRNATAYWERNAGRYAGFEVEYRVRPAAAEPDLVVSFVDDVPNCGEVEEAAGCAPYVTGSRAIDRPERVYVETGLAAGSARTVLAHELGHTLGLSHDDPPADLMASRSVLYTEPSPNATERSFPWSDGDFAVYVGTEGVADPGAVRRQVRHALDYYAAGADGAVPANLSFRFVDSADRADVTVRFADGAACGEGAGSCFTTVGPDPDGDGAIERYAQLRIVLVDLETEAVGWHVGNWLAYGLGMERPAERPPPFRDASHDERRSAWWK